MSRRPAMLTLSFAALLMMGGCDAASTAPGKTEFPNGAPTPAIIMQYMAEDSSAADFVVTPSGGYFNLGPHGVYFPPNAICDPATSEYGVEHWDKRCRTRSAIPRPASTGWSIGTSDAARSGMAS